MIDQLIPVANNDDSKFIVLLKLIIGVSTSIIIGILSISSAIRVLNLKHKKIGFRNDA
jgi:hypothetical protein